MSVVSNEVATKDINKWLDYRKIKEADRVKYKAVVNNLIDGVEQGILVVNTDHSITHKLEIPIIIANTETSSITYKGRLTVGEIRSKTAGINPTDADGRTVAYAAALTGLDVKVIDHMDSMDYEYMSNVVLFFN